MNVTHLNSAMLRDEWFASDPETRMTANYPVWVGDQPQSCAVVFLPMRPGGAILPHRDSAEEMILILDGIVEVQVGKESHVVGPGNVVLVPAGQDHALRNFAPGPARAVGFFASATVVTTFVEPLLPSRTQVFEMNLA